MACMGNRNWIDSVVGNRRLSRKCGIRPQVRKNSVFSCLLTYEHYRLRGKSRYAHIDVFLRNYTYSNHPPLAG